MFDHQVVAAVERYEPRASDAPRQLAPLFEWHHFVAATVRHQRRYGDTRQQTDDIDLAHRALQTLRIFWGAGEALAAGNALATSAA